MTMFLQDNTTVGKYSQINFPALSIDGLALCLPHAYNDAYLFSFTIKKAAFEKCCKNIVK